MRPVTLHDLAKRCNVSTATVSAVVNGAEWVSPKTRRRVQRAIDEMGYHPNQLARGLKRREGHAVGVIVSDLTNPFFTQIVRSLSHAVRASGRTLSLCDSDHRLDLGESNLRALLESQIIGLVVIGDSVPERALRAFVRARPRVPVIAIERDYRIAQISPLLVDSEHGGFVATRHLVECGSRRIAMITGPSSGAGSATYGRAKRFEGYQRALAESGMEFDPGLVVEGNFRFESGRDAMTQLLSLRRPPDAVFAANDMMALGAMTAVRDAGLSIPDDIALVGFDNVPMSSLITPGLTTMAMPMGELGDAAARLLDAHIAASGDGEPPRVREMFSAELVARASTLGTSPAFT
ncbi:MAG TPA: LacI family DNA-binding transcriptional regulator [Gemmatimonadaceae bacterium]|jgi:LacI family transcriptional regulator|nr:LacI family DNA-binding transcriptional regulator [Gemmatimonadaceae bacterium]